MTPPDEDEPEEGPVLSPEELDIQDDEHVEEIDDGRFVVSPDGPPKTDPNLGNREDAADEPAAPAAAEDQGPPPLTEPVVHAWLRDQFAESDARYGFDVTASFDGSVSQQRMASNDIVTVFESLTLWYARHVDDETPVEEVLGILLMESNVPVRYPAGSLEALVDSTDLDREDSIADLLAAVEDEDGLLF